MREVGSAFYHGVIGMPGVVLRFYYQFLSIFFSFWHFQHYDSVFMPCLLQTAVGSLLHFLRVLLKLAYLRVRATPGFCWAQGKVYQGRPTFHMSRY